MLRNSFCATQYSIWCASTLAESKGESSRVRVRLSVGGVDVEVECGVGEVGSVVDEVLRVLKDHGVEGGAATSINNRTAVGRGETCKGLLMKLWQESWFELGRSLSDVHGELARRGFHYDRTAVAHALVDLVREGILTRLGKARRYKYVQKRPPQSAGT